MAKKKTQNSNGKKLSKTDAIRDALKNSANGSPSEVAAKLNKQGIKVTPQYVSTIKANDKRRAESGAPRRKPGRPAGTSKATAARTTASSGDDLKEASELMLHAVELVLRAGAKEARQLITMAEGVVDKISDNR
jgi:hypothetical protein